MAVPPDTQTRRAHMQALEDSQPALTAKLDELDQRSEQDQAFLSSVVVRARAIEEIVAKAVAINCVSTEARMKLLPAWRHSHVKQGWCSQKGT